MARCLVRLVGDPGLSEWMRLPRVPVAGDLIDLGRDGDWQPEELQGLTVVVRKVTFMVARRHDTTDAEAYVVVGVPGR